MSYKEKIIKQLRKGYSPIETGPKEEINRIFKNAFKPRVDKNDLDFFFELSETNETKLKAWGFLGIYYILDDKTITDDKKKLRFQKIDLIFLDLLKPHRATSFVLLFHPLNGLKELSTYQS